MPGNLQFDLVLKVAEKTGCSPFGFNLYGQKRIYISTNKWERRQQRFLYFLTCTLTLALLLQLAYLLLFGGLVILDSLNVIVPIIIYAAASVIHLNLSWKLEEHMEFMNQIYFFLAKFNSKPLPLPYSDFTIIICFYTYYM